MYTYQDWKDFTKSFKLKHKDIAEILGLTQDSVKSTIGKNKPLPKWAIAMVWSWKNNYKTK